MGEEAYLCRKAKRKRDRDCPEIDLAQGGGALPRQRARSWARPGLRWLIGRKPLTVWQEAEFVRIPMQKDDDTEHDNDHHYGKGDIQAQGKSTAGDQKEEQRGDKHAAMTSNVA